MELKYFDAHTHAHFPVYSGEREAMLERARNAGVGMITVGTSRKTSAEAVALAEEYDFMWAAIGLYPGHTVESDRDENEYGVSNDKKKISAEFFDYDFFKTLAESAKVVAVGECGLDILYADTEMKMETQKGEFVTQIRFANDINRPLMIHCRDLYGDVVKLFETHNPKRNPIIHSFRGTVAEAKRFLDYGCYFTFGGVITFRPKKDGIDYADVVRSIPIDHLLSETDAPWVAPVPYRGKRNEPAYVVEVVKKLAEIKNVSEEVMREQILENTKKAFEIKF